MGITNPLVSTTAQRKTVWGTVFLRKAMRLVKIKDALSSDDLNLVGIEKDRHLGDFYLSFFIKNLNNAKLSSLFVASNQI